ncbi:helix-turn-helix domain-containing protein [uncultured Cohaesibacter sp.]|uniref:helix-turn-helix domain-containing protein n=1 Tax=uncultured Cohaesibacter sp. TaxID=1002546 RepID=UPI003748A75E
MSVLVSNWAWGLQCVQGTTKLVLMALADSADDTGACWPRVDTIAHKATASRATVKRALKKLEEIGLLRRKERLREDGSQASNVYHLAVGIDVPTPEITLDEQDELELETAEKVGAQNEPLGVQIEPGGVHRRTGEGFIGEPGRGSPVSPHIEPPIKPPFEPTLTLSGHGLSPASFGEPQRQKRSRRKRDRDKLVEPERRQVIVWKDSEPWKAWAATRSRPWPTVDMRDPATGRFKPGWHFPSKWPPGHPQAERSQGGQEGEGG